MNPLILSKIRQFSGYAHESAGVISAFFDSPAIARACGEEIKLLTGEQLGVCGTQLTIWR